ncbi:MAG: tyrosine-protein phosphatase [Clostridia bacterium]|nr:tyrosine-protein phosphatase [Clostridia bacterium]
MIRLITPAQGETVRLLMDEHLAYIAKPEGFPTDRVDWLNLHEEQNDLSYPRPVHFSYEPAVDGEVLIWEKGREERLCVKAVRGEADVPNFLIDTDYEWCVKIGEEISEIRTFHTDPQAPRMLLVDGISNVRDFGGFSTTDGKRIRQGLLYRTSEMDTHYEITPEGKETFYNMGIRTDLDIRGVKDEYRAPQLDTERVRWVNIALAAYGHIYTEEQMQRYRETYDVLLDPQNYPIICHCWGGIDRTGCWLYILGAMLGVSEDDLGLDYELSSFSRWHRRSRHSEQFGEFLSGLHAYGENIQDGAIGFLKACGVTEEEMDQLREIFLEEI